MPPGTMTSVLADRQFSDGDETFLLVGSANRDPERYAEPDRYSFDRANRDHLAFGSGLHLCLGAPLSRLEGSTIVARRQPFELERPVRTRARPGTARLLEKVDALGF
jgi:cytochrome P450